MQKNTISNITVLGAGTMGSAIAQFFAGRGLDVALYSRTEKTLANALQSIRENVVMEAALKAGKDPDPECGAKADEVIGRITTYTDLAEACRNADWVIETVAENADVKKTVIEAADRAMPADAYLTSDTSALNIYQFLETGRPDRVMITHFFNPASVMPLVEMVPGPETSPETVACLKEFLKKTGKQPIVIKECIPGFIANRLTLALAREAYYLAGQGYASIDDIDKVITTTFGPRYVFEGIFDLYDHIGMDVGYAVAKDLLPKLCSSTEVPELMKQKLEAGELGVKTGKGLKDYTGKDPAEIKKERNRKVIESFSYIEKLF